MASIGIINAFWLKVAMVILMILDHLYYYLFPDSLLFAHYLARVVAPVFTYLMTQGMVYTRNREKYILRIFGFSAIMILGNAIMLYFTKIKVENNIFLSLAIGGSIIYCIDKLKEDKNRPLWLILTCLFLFSSFFCEGGYLVPLMAVIFYYLRFNHKLMYFTFIASTGVPFIMTYVLNGRLQPQFFMIFSVLPLLLYNGKRGYDGFFAKYFFYLIYPLHVWVIVLAKYFAK